MKSVGSARSKARYQEFLRADSGKTFIEWLRTYGWWHEAAKRHAQRRGR